MDNVENSLQSLPDSLIRFPSSHLFRDGIQECDFGLGVRGNHAIANAGERYPEKLTLLSKFCRLLFQRFFCRNKFPFCSFAGEENRPSILQGYGTDQFFFVIVWIH